jgi:precorrin-6A/cobalt-precorrin-6A reductase
MTNEFRNVLLITGESDSTRIMQELLDSKVKLIVTTTTKSKADIIFENENITYLGRQFTSEAFVRLVGKFNIKCIVDASHGFAVDVSRNAMKAAEREDINYIRYEKPVSKFDDPNKKIKKVDSYKSVVKEISKSKGNVFIATGSNNLFKYKDLIKKDASRLFFKVIPESHGIKICEDLGLKSDNIIAIKGIFSEEMYSSILEQFKIQVFVFKESGTAGAYVEKMHAALGKNIKIIVLKRPKFDYACVVSTIAEVIYKVGSSMVQQDK